jgi:iron(III) transport system ATP-binding protein
MDLTKRFGSVTAVDGVTLHVDDGIFLTLLGPSGCGKSTTLRLIAGLEQPDAGEIYAGKELVASASTGTFLPPEKRRFGMVFQSYAVWPHMTAFDNVAYPLRAQKLPRDEAKSRVEKALEMVRLKGYEDRYPNQLSGGQQQRVALARALVHEPRILLLDEPLSNLDAKLRERMRVELKELQRKLGVTSIYVTHDQIEALALSDIVAVMNNGRILQLGTPHDVYEKPQDSFVADFIGQANLFHGKVVEGDAAQTSMGLVKCILPSDAKVGDEILVSIRPSHIKVETLDECKIAMGSNVFEGKLENIVFLGEYYEGIISIGNERLRIRVAEGPSKSEGDAVRVYLPQDKCLAIKRPS